MITDFHDLAGIQAAIYAKCEALEKLRDEYAASRQVVEYDSERRKCALAGETVKQLEAGKGAAASEAYARTSPEYHAAMRKLGDQFTAAQAVISRYHATITTLDALRSILSTQRSLIKEL